VCSADLERRALSARGEVGLPEVGDGHDAAALRHAGGPAGRQGALHLPAALGLDARDVVDGLAREPHEVDRRTGGRSLVAGPAGTLPLVAGPAGTLPLVTGPAGTLPLVTGPVGAGDLGRTGRQVGLGR